MSKKANPALIGFFAIGAFLLAVVAIVFFGSGSLFQKREQFVLYFEDSVNGLEIGSAVKFKGVTIGSVKSIRIRFDQADEVAHIPVVIEINTDRLKNNLGVNVDLSDEQEFMEQVRIGLRAKLQFQSYVTGMLFVELDYYPDAGPPILYYIGADGLKEIPTIGSGLNEIWKTAGSIMEKINSIDFVAISDQLTGLLAGLNEGVGQIDFATINTNVIEITEDAKALLSDPAVKQAVANLDVALKQISELVTNLNDQVDPLSTELQATSLQARNTLIETEKTIANIRQLLQPESSLRYELDTALQEFAAAARSIRVLADYLERNPNALITGKAPKE